MDPKTGEVKPVIISVDDGIRPDTNMKSLAKLKPAFAKDGSTTAGIKMITCLWNLLARAISILVIFAYSNFELRSCNMIFREC